MLAIVEVPDGVQWEIAKHDGVEHVAETHRCWFPVYLVKGKEKRKAYDEKSENKALALLE